MKKIYSVTAVSYMCKRLTSVNGWTFCLKYLWSVWGGPALGLDSFHIKRVCMDGEAGDLWLGRIPEYASEHYNWVNHTVTCVYLCEPMKWVFAFR